MKAINLKKEIEKRGGFAKIVVETKTASLRYGQTEPETYESVELIGELNGHDVHMHSDESSFYTTRRISDRGYNDPGSDYNPSGYTFCNRIKDLDWATK